MTAPQGFGGRIRQAVLDHASRLGRQYSLSEFGREVGQLERNREYTPSAVTEWLAERSEPSISTFRAMAKVTGKDVAWLMALDIEPSAREVDAVVHNSDGTIALIQTKSSSNPKPRPPASRGAKPAPIDSFEKMSSKQIAAEKAKAAKNAKGKKA